ncbi:MAG: chemotaxis protein CheW [Deltaproteobacteria bacterium]|nr:chemotaxis protein CheW [Deltaproteobacteria bacterium]
MTSRQFVTFRIDDHLVGIDILKVREINRVLEITPVQHAPAYVRGLVNLRGRTVTIFDLGIRLGLPPRSITETSHNVILKPDDVGLLVDGIGDVEEAAETAVEAPPANLNGIGAAFIECVVRLKDELILVLRPERILENPRDKGEFT